MIRLAVIAVCFCAAAPAISAAKEVKGLGVTVTKTCDAVASTQGWKSTLSYADKLSAASRTEATKAYLDFRYEFRPSPDGTKLAVFDKANGCSTVIDFQKKKYSASWPVGFSRPDKISVSTHPLVQKAKREWYLNCQKSVPAQKANANILRRSGAETARTGVRIEPIDYCAQRDRDDNLPAFPIRVGKRGFELNIVDGTIFLIPAPVLSKAR